MKQTDVILKAMLDNEETKCWNAIDFQFEPHFVGYEATARMSELAQMYPDVIIAERDGRYRTLRINWKKKREIKKIKKMKGWK